MTLPYELSSGSVMNRLSPFRKFLFLVFTGLFSLFYTQAQISIVAENALPGNPISEWGVNSSDDFRNVNLNGYATDISVNKGGTVHFKIDALDGLAYTVKIYRLGYYNGDGARFKADLGGFIGVKQPAPAISDPTGTGLLDCSNWTETTSWTVPADAVSGFYVAKLTGATDINNILFIVRNDGSSSDILMQANDATWQAYNGYGGSNFYNGTTGFPSNHAVKLSYNRPFFIYNAGFVTDNRGSDWYMNDSYPMIRWLERNGYDVSYTTNVDVARSGSQILTHKIFLAAGHDEYCSKEQRNSIEAARNAGVHCAFFTGNDIYWKTRWENDVNGNANRILVCYKEGTLADGSTGEGTCGFKCDPDPTVWTGLWRMGSAYDAGLPENALLGQISWQQSIGTDIVVPDTYKNLRFWRNTSITALPPGESVDLAPGSLGYEWDYEQFPDNYPYGRITLSNTIFGGYRHKLSLYRYGGTGGPLVFGAGTVQWAWGLDDQHFGGPNVVNKDMQQATANLFADMGVMAGTLQTDLTAPAQSTDFTPPVSAITSPASGITMNSNTTVTIQGTVTDVGGGVAAGAEVSVDGGVTWKIANGFDNWTFDFTPASPGIYTIKSRGYDDSGNMEATGNSGPNVITIFVDVAVPTANAGPDQTIVLPASSVTLDGSGSVGVITSYAWTLVSGPNTPLFITPSAVTTDVTGLIEGVYLFQLAINGGSSTSQVTINVLAFGSNTTIFTTQTPANGTSNDGMEIELGVKFRSSVPGRITGIRFYKTSGNNGLHIGQLYTNTGDLLAQADFTSETSTGWQNVMFGLPVSISADVTYVAAYFSDNGTYTGTANYFNTAVVNEPLTGLASGTDGPNGVYIYSPGPAFPNLSPGNNPNYWVDVLFTPDTGPLPVHYLSFNAVKLGDQVMLQWVTTMEENNKGFEILRSSDNTGWASIGFVAGAGNSQTGKSYQWEDKNPLSGTCYYRLKQIDYDGKSELSKIVKISFGDNLSLELNQNSPNPFNNSTTIDFVLPKAGKVQLFIYDQMGRPVRQVMDEFKLPGSYNVQVNRRGLASGIYYYKLEALGRSIVRKMIIL